MANYDMAHDSVIIPLKGANLSIRDIWYVVVRTVTEQDEPGQFVTMVTLAEIDDEGDILDKAPVQHNLDNLEYTY